MGFFSSFNSFYISLSTIFVYHITYGVWLVHFGGLWYILVLFNGYCALILYTMLIGWCCRFICFALRHSSQIDCFYRVYMNKISTIRILHCALLLIYLFFELVFEVLSFWQHDRCCHSTPFSFSFASPTFRIVSSRCWRAFTVAYLVWGNYCKEILF